MTQEDQYAIIGKAHVDYRDTKRELEAITAKGKQMALAAHSLSEALATNPSARVTPNRPAKK